MVFSDTINEQGIVQDAYWEAGADANSYPIKHVVRNANLGLDEAVSIIIGADGAWQFDDTNSTDIPIGSTDLMLGQQDYSFDDDHLVIKTVEVCDAAGNWRRLDPIDNNSVPREVALSTLNLTSGNPAYYDKVGSSLLLYPAPSYNRRLVEEGESGLRVYFQRQISYFTTTDTVKEPGFAKHLHKYISLYVAYAYAAAKETSRQAALGQKLAIYADKIKKFYGYREIDRHKRIKTNTRVKR